jgi:hypothetical protein
MTIQTDRVQQLIHGYTRQLKVREQLQKKSALGTLTEDTVTLSVEAKKLNIREIMASKVYRKITEQEPNG